MQQDDRGPRGEGTTWQRSDEKRLRGKERENGESRRGREERNRRNNEGGRVTGEGGHSGAGVQRVMVIASEYPTSSEGVPMCPQKRRSSRGAERVRGGG